MAQDGETMRLWGQPFKPYNAQDRRRIEYRFYQKDGKPQKIELYVVARDKDGQAKEPKTLEIPWMLPPYERPQVLKLPKDQKPFRYTKVGYLEAKDALETGRRGVYAWLVYVREDTVKKEKELHIMSHLRPPGNSYFTEKKANETAVRMEARGEDMKLWGIPFHGNSDKDLRKMEYRFYQKNGKPHQLEIFAVTRNRDQSAKPAQSLRIDWPW
jgi:hypothetical protein